MSFKVYCIDVPNKSKTYCHWSDGLRMFITKDGVTIELEGHEIQQLVKSLPSTVGRTY